MRLSFLLLLLLLAASAGTNRMESTAQKVDQGAEEESDPCADAPPGTVLCGRIRIPVG